MVALSHESTLMATDTLSGILDALKAKYVEIAPTWLDPSWRRQTPATEEEIAAYEAHVGYSFEPQLREFFATCDCSITTDGNYGYEGFDQMGKNNWQIMTDLLEDGTFTSDNFLSRVEDSGDKLVKAYWDRGWMPFVVDGGGNMICVDHNPGPNGVVGQVIQMEAQDGMGPFISEYTSLLDYLNAQLDLLNAGKYMIEEEGFITIDRWA